MNQNSTMGKHARTLLFSHPACLSVKILSQPLLSLPVPVMSWTTSAVVKAVPILAWALPFPLMAECFLDPWAGERC